MAVTATTAPPSSPPSATPPPPVVAPVTLTNTNTIDLAGVVARHLWQEYHWKAPTDGYRGKTLDDRRVAEDLVDSTLQAKSSLNTSFCEHAIATVEVSVPDDQTLYMRWWLEDMAGDLVAEHPDFSKAKADAKNAAAKISTGKYAWRWDGRRPNTAGRRVLMRDEPCWSMIEIKKKDGAIAPLGPLATSSISTHGAPYRVFVVGDPKDDTNLTAEMEGPGGGRWLNNAGDRLQGDCWIKVYRGKLDSPGHLAFLGHGAIEATSYNTNKNGAIATPHDRDHKAWIRRGTHGGVTFWLCELIDITAPTQGSHLISLDRPAGLPVPNNPFCDTQPNQPFKDGVHGHNSFPVSGSAYVIDGASVGCTTVRTLTGGSQAAPVARLGEIQCNKASFGTWNGAEPGNTDNTPWGPPLEGGSPGSFWNKQTKRDRVLDALLPDVFASPLIIPPKLNATTNVFDPPSTDADREEPLHMQHTMQQALLGGFLEHEIPASPAVPAEPEANEPGVNPKVRYRVKLRHAPERSLYHQYHRLAVFGHSVEPGLNAASFQCWIPRTLQRLWNGNWRNVLVKDAMRYAWYIEERWDDQRARRAYIGTKPTGAAMWASLADGSIGKYRKANLALPAIKPQSAASRFFSVFKYQIRLAPQPKADTHVWQAMDAADDLFTHELTRASLLAEQIVVEANVSYLEGQSELEFAYPSAGDFPGTPGTPGTPRAPGAPGTPGRPGGNGTAPA